MAVRVVMSVGEIAIETFSVSKKVKQMGALLKEPLLLMKRVWSVYLSDKSGQF